MRYWSQARFIFSCSACCQSRSFAAFPYRALAAFTGLLVFTSRVLWPVLELGARIGQMLFRRTDAPPRLFAAREDLKQLAVESERQGALTSSERAMIHNVVDFRTVKVADVMVPRKQVVAARPETTVPELLELSAKMGIDRVPVMTEDGNALGLINVFDVLLDQSPPKELGYYVGPIVSASESESAYRIIRRLRAAHSTLATVFDDKRKLTGIATVEDLVRRLVQSA